MGIYYNTKSINRAFYQYSSFHLQDKKFNLALRQYERAADLVSENSVSKDEEKEIVAPVYRTVKLNVAAVHLQLKNYERARDACDTVCGCVKYRAIYPYTHTHTHTTMITCHVGTCSHIILIVESCSLH